MYRHAPMIPALILLLAACAPDLLPLDPIGSPADGSSLPPPSDAPASDAGLPLADATPVPGDALPPADVPTVEVGNPDRPPMVDAGTPDAGPPPVDRPAPPTDTGPACPACPAPPHALATCAGGRCGWTCLAGWGDCDGQPINGCETDLRTASGHCGACGTACAEDAVCTAGACGCTAPGATVCGVACLDLTVTRSRCLFCARYCFPPPGSTRPECCAAACRGC